jgi:hypothetical protein
MNLLSTSSTAASGERDVNQPQARDKTAPFFPNATNTFNSGEAEL